MEIMDFLTLLAVALLIVALPIVIAAAFQHYRVMTARLRANNEADRIDMIERAVRLAATVAQQTGIGAEARRRAVKFAQDFLDERGVKVNVEQLATLIESEINKQIAQPNMPADSPLARQALLQSAIESAVLAAEQSGLKGLIQNTAVDKKTYAMEMARRYLAEHGLAVDEGLISGLIEAQLLRMFLAARNEVPASSIPAPQG